MRYRYIDEDLELSNKDNALLDVADSYSDIHDSGGSYSMAALYARSKPIEVGYNSLLNPAHLKVDAYPDICGMHAELNLWTKREIGNGSVYISGVNTKSRNRMNNTVPCVYCTALMHEAGVRNVICYRDGRRVKYAMRNLAQALRVAS